MTTPSVEARTAARWWADKLRDDFTPDNGDTSQAGAMTTVLASLSREQDRKDLSATKIDAFEAALTGRIQTMIDNGVQMGFGVDYHPDPELADSLEDAGIRASMTTLPWKTVMWVGPGKVRVGCGYGAPIQDVPFLGDSTSR